MSDGRERLQFRSPAEFFAENQNIAGFDNPGKALYTTIRELVENGLDAAESIGDLPSIHVTVHEISHAAFNAMRGVNAERLDETLFSHKGWEEEAKSGAAASAKASGKGEGKGREKKRKKHGYFRVTCKDNGVGMPHKSIPDMFGRVLAGSKYGVRQTRGKFGLGAKMALIWSRKSTGMPIEITTAFSRAGSQGPPASTYSYCKLDIDIHKNVPNVQEHKRRSNTDGWRGTRVDLYIGGNWTSYRARILSYLRQLAIITPYAEFKLDYTMEDMPKRAFSVAYHRRSNKMPPLATEVKHHPKSVNNLLVKQILDRHPSMLLQKCLHTEFACVSKPLSKRLMTELGKRFEDVACGELTSRQIHQLTTLLRAAKFPAPSDKCLSPAGEYNLRLGIMKELEPQLVATTTSKPFGYEGHAFLVEAGVSLGGKLGKEGITVHRFANRIPLLFEGGADVVTHTANAINWSHYKIDQKKEKIGVFVSIVSTKIPFKGTGKEYIGHDIVEIATAVQRALRTCALQLKSFVTRRDAERDRANRQAMMYKFIPDAAGAVMRLLQQASERKREETEFGHTSPRATKRRRLLRSVKDGSVTQKALEVKLKAAVDADHSAGAVDHARAVGQSLLDTKLFIPALQATSVRLESHTTYHPLCAIRWLRLATEWDALDVDWE